MQVERRLEPSMTVFRGRYQPIEEMLLVMCYITLSVYTEHQSLLPKSLSIFRDKIKEEGEGV